jgi:hypothetical protein
MHSVAMYRKENEFVRRGKVLKNVIIGQFLEADEFIDYDKNNDLSVLVCRYNMNAICYKTLEKLEAAIQRRKKKRRMKIFLFVQNDESIGKAYDVAWHVYITWIIQHVDIIRDLRLNIMRFYMDTLDIKGIDLLRRTNIIRVVSYKDTDELPALLMNQH